MVRFLSLAAAVGVLVSGPVLAQSNTQSNTQSNGGSEGGHGFYHEGVINPQGPTRIWNGTPGNGASNAAPGGWNGAVGADGPVGASGAVGSSGPVGGSGAVGASGPVGSGGSVGPGGAVGASGPFTGGQGH